ncbi:MAG: hypothetical protein HKP25_09415 [Marinicaulis sp.]|nr:hypothetical protein [Marinicaulis sp.]NNL89278.1 hypothetical protein [Marinicaulis sp.]
MKFLGLIVALVFLPLASATAEEKSILEKFEGTWGSEGDAFGSPAESTMVWSRALNDKFYRLDYRIEMRPASGEPQTFEGLAIYRADDDGYYAYWADTSGDFLPVTAIRDGDALVAHWGETGAKQGRTRYELIDGDKIEITDWILTPEGWRRFNNNVFARAD